MSVREGMSLEKNPRAGDPKTASLFPERIPPLLHPLLGEYTRRLHERLPGLIGGFYIIGSIALDGFNERLSDIDFVAVLNRRASPPEVEGLRAIHQAIAKNFPAWDLAGSYLQATDLGRFEGEAEPHPYHHDGKLHENGHFEINSVTWWTLKNRGIPLWGPSPSELPFEVDWEELLRRMKENLNTYWGGWTKRPGRLAMLLSDWGIQWAVPGVLRQYYTFRENSITTKGKAAEYALTCLPARWHTLIQEAIDLRQGKKPSHYRSRIFRMIETVRFLKYIIQLSNGTFPIPLS